MQTTVQRNSRSLDMSRAVLDLIALRKPEKAIFSELWKKKSISILHVVDMPFEWTVNLIFFFYRAVLPDLSDSLRNQKKS